MSLKFDRFPIRSLTVGRFWSWLARSEPGAALEYHRGLLILDRSPGSELSEDERRTVAKIADAVSSAAERRLVHLVQRPQRPVRLQLRRDQGRTGARQTSPTPPSRCRRRRPAGGCLSELEMGTSFERHGIDHLSASSLNLWAAEPALWVMERLLGRRSPIHMGNAIRELYADFEHERTSHPGQVPVVACTGSEPMKDCYGVNYMPLLELVKWVDRPAELPDGQPGRAVRDVAGRAGGDSPTAGHPRAAAATGAGR